MTAGVAAGNAHPLVGVVGGSRSDFPVLEQATALLDRLGVSNELRVVSAHRSQMPRGSPVATVAIGNAENAALLAVAILALTDAALADRLAAYRAEMTAMVMDDPSNAEPL